MEAVLDLWSQAGSACVLAVRRARAVRTRRTDPRDEQAGGPTDRSEDPTAGDRELLSVLSSPRGSPNCPPASSGGGVRERPGAGARAATCQRLPLQGRAVLPARARVWSGGVRGETWRALVLKERPDRPGPGRRGPKLGPAPAC